MFEDQIFDLDGRRYVWSYDPSANSPAKSLEWRDEANCMKPPEAVLGRLNRKYIDERAADMVVERDDAQGAWFAKILRSMDATRDDLMATGIEPCFLAAPSDPIRNPFLAMMPPAAHTPFNSPRLRDWFFQNPAPFPTGFQTVGT